MFLNYFFFSKNRRREKWPSWQRNWVEKLTHYTLVWCLYTLTSYRRWCRMQYYTIMPRSHIHGSPRRFYYGLNLTDDAGNAKFRSPIRMHYIRMIKYYYVWLRMQYGKLRTNMDCHGWCRIVSVANPASSPWMCDLGINKILYYIVGFINKWAPWGFGDLGRMAVCFHGAGEHW